MPLTKINHVSAVDHQLVTDAVAAAELHTSGEIVTIVTDLSDDYTALDEDAMQTDQQVLDLLEEANALLSAASQHRSSPTFRAVTEADCGAGERTPSTSGMLNDPRD